MVRFAYAALLAMLVACPHDDDAPLDAAVVPDAPAITLMDPRERGAATNAAVDRMYELEAAGLPRDQVTAQMVDFLRAHPAFASAGYSARADNIWANFRDGVPFIIFDNRRPNPDVVPDSDAMRALESDTVPKDSQYRILRSTFDGFDSSASATRILLTRTGYRPARQSDSIQDLMTDVTGDGFFMWETHGGDYELLLDPTKRYGLSTTTLAPFESEEREPYNSLLASGELGIGYSEIRLATPEEVATANNKGRIDDITSITQQPGLPPYLARRVYMVNSKFIGTRFKFSDTSVVIINACSSFSQEMRDAFKRAGAGAYLGWDGVVMHNGHISLLAVDRMIGTSVAPPLPVPKQRPFDIRSVFQWMEANGLNVDVVSPANTTRFRFEILRGSYGLLAPSIKAIRITEPAFKGMKARAEVLGLFGTLDDASYPRELLVADRSQTLAGGDRETVLADLEPGSFGETVVKVGGRVSNSVPITAWNVPIKIEATSASPDSAKYTVTGHVLVRADVHRFRERPGAAADNSLAAAGERALLMEGSTVSWTASGSFRVGDCTHTLSGTGSAGLAIEGQGMTPFIAGVGTFDPGAGRFQFNAFVLGMGFMKDAVVCDGVSGTADFPIVVPPRMTFEIDRDTFEIKGGEATWSIPVFQIKTTWEPVLPFNPPTSLTPS